MSQACVLQVSQFFTLRKSQENLTMWPRLTKWKRRRMELRRRRSASLGGFLFQARGPQWPAGFDTFKKTMRLSWTSANLILTIGIYWYLLFLRYFCCCCWWWWWWCRRRHWVRPGGWGSLLKPWRFPDAASLAELAKAWWSTLVWAHAPCLRSQCCIPALQKTRIFDEILILLVSPMRRWLILPNLF